MPCACGCSGTPAPGKAYVHGHNLAAVNAAIPVDERRRRGLRNAALRTREEWAAWGRRGGRTTNIKRWAALIAIWRTQNPTEALRAAWDHGYHAGYDAGRKRREEKQHGRS